MSRIRTGHALSPTRRAQQPRQRLDDIHARLADCLTVTSAIQESLAKTSKEIDRAFDEGVLSERARVIEVIAERTAEIEAERSSAPVEARKVPRPTEEDVNAAIQDQRWRAARLGDLLDRERAWDWYASADDRDDRMAVVASSDAYWLVYRGKYPDSAVRHSTEAVAREAMRAMTEHT